MERLFRSRNKRFIGGVAGGLGDYLNLDPVILRILFIIITIVNGLGLLLYIILWIVIPEAPLESQYSDEYSTTSSNPGTSEANTSGDSESKSEMAAKNGRMVLGVSLIAIGTIFLLDNFWPSFNFEDLLPLLFIGIGAAIIWKSTNNKEKIK